MKNRMKIIHLYPIFLLLLVSCASTPECPPCNPELELVDKPLPYPVLIKITPLGPLVLPDRPPWPGDDAVDGEKAEAAIAIGEAIEEREALLIARDKAWRLKVETHNSQEIDADEPGPLPD